jgi:hypothetical protein
MTAAAVPTLELRPSLRRPAVLYVTVALLAFSVLVVVVAVQDDRFGGLDDWLSCTILAGVPLAAAVMNSRTPRLVVTSTTIGLRAESGRVHWAPRSALAAIVEPNETYAFFVDGDQRTLWRTPRMSWTDEQLEEFCQAVGIGPPRSQPMPAPPRRAVVLWYLSVSTIIAWFAILGWAAHQDDVIPETVGILVAFGVLTGGFAARIQAGRWWLVRSPHVRRSWWRLPSDA